jgi:hypothetical protein
MKKGFLPLLSILLFPAFVMLGSCSDVTAEIPQVEWYESAGGGNDIVMENNFLEFRFLPKTAEFILTEKSTGSVWRSNPENAASDPIADVLTKQRMQSQFTLVYANKRRLDMSMNSAKHSVENNMFEYAVTGNALEVHYTVSTVTRVNYIPQAVQEERLLLFLEKMSRANRIQVESGFRLVDINKLVVGDNKVTMLELYPDLADGRVYILRDSLTTFVKNRIDDFLKEADYTFDDYTEDTARHNAVSEEVVPVFNITIRYELDGNSLLVSVPFEKIAYRSEHPIMQLNLLPYFGAGTIDDDGYLFVPDGSGALIRFNNGKQGQLEYNNTIYGWDAAQYREVAVQDNIAPFPVFGIQKNGSALMCVIEDGSAYGEVSADISGRNSQWNRVSGQFGLLQRAQFSLSVQTIDSEVFRYQNGLSIAEGITERFIPCKEGGYVGMAKEYREYLTAKYPHLKNNISGAPPVAVEIIGAVNKTQHRLGIPFNLPLELTSYSEIEQMIENFASMGWEGVYIKSIGWFNGSVEHEVPTNIRLISELGNRRDFINLASAARDFGYQFYAEGDFVFMRKNSLFDGFTLFSDASRYITRETAEIHQNSFITFGQSKGDGRPSYLARPQYTVSLVENFIPNLDKLGVTGIAFRSIGAKLGGDYYDKRLVTREETMKMQQELLAKMKTQSLGILLNTGHAFAAPYADIITDMAINDQKFGITDESVPFYQIVLHGLVPYTGRAINLAEDYTINLLKTIETGAGLYFSFMAEDSAILQDTDYHRFYANQYDKWIGDADSLYQQFTRDFNGLYNQPIINHEILAPDVTITEYRNGTKVVVNTGGAAYDYHGIKIGGYDYSVVKGGGK